MSSKDDDGDQKRKADDSRGSGSVSSQSEASTTKPAVIKPAPKKRRKEPPKEPDYPVQPNTIQVVKKPKTHVNHSYRDFSNVPTTHPYTLPSKVEEMAFAEKVYYLLSGSDEHAAEAMEWCSHGRAFRISNEGILENFGLLKKYFGYNRSSKFRKQLVNHGFKELTQGRDNGCFYSEFMLRGLPHLLQYIPAPVEKRKQIPDPDNEPDFYEISKLFSLPDHFNSIVEEAKAGLAARGIVIQDDPPLHPQSVASMQGAAQTNNPNLSLLHALNQSMMGMASQRLPYAINPVASLPQPLPVELLLAHQRQQEMDRELARRATLTAILQEEEKRQQQDKQGEK